MIENESSRQLELFSETGESGVKDREARSSFLKRLWHYEKTILLAICLVSTGIIAFSLGVEKGKKMNLSSTALPARANLIQKAGPTRQVNTRPQAESAESKEVKEEPKEPAYYQGFTIQLASYRTKSFAEKEALSLKKKGLVPLVLNRGNYIVLCVGNFSDRTQAQLLLPQLKKRYADCRIRRL